MEPCWAQHLLDIIRHLNDGCVSSLTSGAWMAWVGCNILERESIGQVHQRVTWTAQRPGWEMEKLSRMREQ